MRSASLNSELYKTNVIFHLLSLSEPALVEFAIDFIIGIPYYLSLGPLVALKWGDGFLLFFLSLKFYSAAFDIFLH